MSDAGPSGASSARDRFLAEVFERTQLLRELTQQLADNPATPAARGALRHRLQTLRVSADALGQTDLAQHAEAALACLQGSQDPQADEDARSRALQELRALIEALPQVAKVGESPAEDLHASSSETRSTGQRPRRDTPLSTTVTEQALHAEREARSQEGVGLSAVDDDSVAGVGDDVPAGIAAHPAGATETAGSRITQDRPAGGNSPFFEASEPVPQADQAARGVPMVLTQTVPGLLATPAMVHLLVLDDALTVARVRNALPEDRFEVTGARDPGEALSLIHAVSPRVVLIGQSLVEDPSLQLVERIRKDPIGDVRHVLLLAPRATQETAARLGCDAWVRKPVEGPLLLALLERLLNQQSDRVSALQELTEGTVDDIAQRVAEEIRRGLSESLQVGRDERIEIEDSGELMAAAWSAVGRVRAHLASRSDGRVRFDPSGTATRATLPMTEHEGAEPGDVAAADILAGHRVLVADDDPAVLWFFAGLLREAGAEVLEAKNGREALELARLRRPHVIISDILMPRIDGFALCRELKRDVVLWDVPVILLSWKEDFLLRMRELQSGAAAYLRKESGSRQILATVAETLKPRVRLRAQLAADAEVRGRIEQLSVLSVIEQTATRVQDACVTVRDAYNLYEIQLREGSQVSVTRTASDGTFCRGPRALQQALGVRSGRFAITRQSGVLRGAFEQSLHEALREAAHRMGALLDAVSDKRLLRVGQVEFDDELLSALTDVTPATVMEFLDDLHQPGVPLRDRLLSGALVPQIAEDHLRELARTGAITAVWDVDGQDLVAEAFQALSNDPGRLVHVSLPPPRPSEQEAETAPEPSASQPSSLLRSRNDTMPDLMGPERDTGDIALTELGSHPPSVLKRVLSPESEEVVGTPSSITSQAADPVGNEDDGPVAAPEPDAAIESPQDPLPATRSRRETELLSFTVGEEQASEATAPTTPEPVIAAGVDEAEDAVPDPPPRGVDTAEAVPTDNDLLSRLALAASFAALAALGFFGFRALGVQKLLSESRRHATEVVSDSASAITTDVSSASNPSGAADEGPIEGEFGRVVRFIEVHHGVAVADDEGLLVVNAGEADEPPKIRVGDKELGQAPVVTALKEGRHEFVVSQEGRTSYRHLIIRRGETRVVDIP